VVAKQEPDAAMPLIAVGPAAQLTPECMDLLNRILTPKEEDRITIPEIVRHPWCVGSPV